MFKFIKSLFGKHEESKGSADMRVVAGSPDVVVAKSGPVVIEKKKGGKKTGNTKKSGKSKGK